MAEERAQTKEKRMQTLGWVATAMSVMMYVSYIPQIIGNLHGNKGRLHPAIRSSSELHVMGHLWTVQREARPTAAAANFPGVIFGLIAASTALI